MAYFLKKTKLKNRTYLAIYESFYSHEKKGTAHRCCKSLGSVETLTAGGMADPVAFFQAEVDSLNQAKKAGGTPKISAVSPLIYMGYFPLKSIMEKLETKRYIDLFILTNDFQFDLYEFLSSLVYARSVNPCCKLRTFHEVLPSLFHPCNYSYDQLLDGLSFLGANYEKIVELFTAQTSAAYGISTDRTYFDCTNFFFEIDREDGFRMKGPSKENKKDPIVGLGLLLDNNLVPVGMKMYPGNESEKPVLREVVSQMKKQHNIGGRTIHVADKGLNCAENIAFSKKAGDGYLFSKAVKMLPEKEKVWVLLDQGFQEVRDKKGKLLYRYKFCVDKFPYDILHEGKMKTVFLTEKRLLTYSPSLAEKRNMKSTGWWKKQSPLRFPRQRKKTLGKAGNMSALRTGKAERPASA